MKDVLTYKEFIASVHFSSIDNLFHGKIKGINDLVSFEGESITELTNAFHQAVEDYIELCKAVDKKPLKSCKGNFNVRVSPEVHRKALEMATIKGISLNQFVQKAIEKELV